MRGPTRMRCIAEPHLADLHDQVAEAVHAHALAGIDQDRGVRRVDDRWTAYQRVSRQCAAVEHWRRVPCAREVDLARAVGRGVTSGVGELGDRGRGGWRSGAHLPAQRLDGRGGIGRALAIAALVLLVEVAHYRRAVDSSNGHADLVNLALV